MQSSQLRCSLLLWCAGHALLLCFSGLLASAIVLVLARWEGSISNGGLIEHVMRMDGIVAHQRSAQ